MGDPEWLQQVQESIVDPELRIIDPHHHLWHRPGSTYVLDDLWRDTESGHRVEKTVFVECRAAYRETGPETLKPVGEVEFVAAIAEASVAGEGPEIAAIVGHADLTLGDAVTPVLEALREAGGGRFRGIRHAGARDSDPGALLIPGRAPEGLYADVAYRAGMRRLGELGYSFDTWHYHHQNGDFRNLAAAVPQTTMVLDHFGTPLGVGRFAGQRKEIFDQWRKDIAAIAALPNVVAKLGGLAMPDNGFGWHDRPLPPTSDEFVEAQAPYYLHAIECFGPDRCMFESNFPVDKLSISYHVLYNGLKKIVAQFSATERDQLFYGTAARVYQIRDEP